MTFLYEKGRKNKLYRRYLQMSMNYYTSFIFYYLVDIDGIGHFI